MKREFDPDRLDVAAFAAAAAALSGSDALTRYPRLVAEASESPASDAVVRWQAQGAQRAAPGATHAPWLHLIVDTALPLVCQRCMGAVQTALNVDRWFRFAVDEATAAAQDDASEEDVLVISREFDLHALIEDELLMSLPVAPLHEVCPGPVQLSAMDEDFEEAQAERPNPFAALARLRGGTKGD
jgi:uncharacterized protein